MYKETGVSGRAHACHHARRMTTVLIVNLPFNDGVDEHKWIEASQGIVTAKVFCGE